MFVANIEWRVDQTNRTFCVKDFTETMKEQTSGLFCASGTYEMF